MDEDEDFGQTTAAFWFKLPKKFYTELREIAQEMGINERKVLVDGMRLLQKDHWWQQSEAAGILADPEKVSEHRRLMSAMASARNMNRTQEWRTERALAGVEARRLKKTVKGKKKATS